MNLRRRFVRPSGVEGNKFTSVPKWMEVFLCVEFCNLEVTKTVTMFDNLLDLVKQNAGNAIINNPAIPNQHNDDAINTAGNSIMNTLTQQASGGNMSQIMSMFQN